MLSKPSLRGAVAKYQIACSRMEPWGHERHRWVNREVERAGANESILSEFRCDPSPAPISEFQPFSCRPSRDGSGEKLQALLSQREVMLQLSLHSQPQILRWT